MSDEVYAAFESLRPYAVWEGVLARAVHGREITMAVVDLEPNAIVAEHHHPNEQLGFILRGELTFTIGGETRRLGVGETYVISADVPHDAVAGPDGASVVDVFSPPRDDWESAPRREPSPGGWPPR